MKYHSISRCVFAVAAACLFGLSATAQTNVPGTFKHIAIDGSFGDWSGVPIAYTAPVGASNAIQYENIYIANDQTNLYIRFTLYSPRAAFANSYDNIFIDADNNPTTGFNVGGIGSSMLIQYGSGYQEKNGGFNEGAINNLGWNIASSSDTLDYELSISLGATYASDSTLVFTNNTIAILMEGDNTSYINSEFAPPSGGLIYPLASAPVPPAANFTLLQLTNSTWEINASGTDLGTNWLSASYDDTVSGWTNGTGLFGYTPSPASYPTIHKALPSGPNTYYFRSHLQWTNDTANVAFVVTNYLSDGAVYYLNGVEVRRVRMPSGTVSYATVASATNSPVGHADVFGIDGSTLLYGDNIMEVETHQAAASSADMVFGLSLTAAVSYPVLVVNTNLPADQGVLAGQSATFTSDVIGSGPLYYQWFFNSTNAIAGANSSSYTIAAVLTTNAGRYSLQVSNSLSSVTTRAALLTVTNIPAGISNQPASQIAVEGKPASFSVVASGTPVISYQWYYSGNVITGATNSVYTIASVLPANAGNYQVVVNNSVSSTNSAVVSLTVLLDTIPPNITNIVATATQVTVTFSESVDPVTATNVSKYSVSGETVTLATLNPANPAQVILTLGSTANFGTVYTLTVNGVKDLFGNPAHVSGQFARSITIDGSFNDWTGLAPVYTSTSPSGNTDAADFEAIYVYNDANYYYFRVTLWTDIDPSAGQFPYYVNMFYDTDNNSATGYNPTPAAPTPFGSEMLIQSGYAYQEKDNSFNDGYGINNLNWLCLPTAPGTNFEFQISRSATFGQDNTTVFSSNAINFIFQGMTPGFVVENTVPPSGSLAYTNVSSVSLVGLPLGKVAINSVASNQVAIVWDEPGSLQYSSKAGGPFTNLTSATSPYIIPATGRQFFRLSK